MERALCCHQSDSNVSTNNKINSFGGNVSCQWFVKHILLRGQKQPIGLSKMTKIVEDGQHQGVWNEGTYQGTATQLLQIKWQHVPSTEWYLTC